MADVPPSDGQVNAGGGTDPLASSETIGSKRQRRPSVRLGDIGGDQAYDSHVRRHTKLSKTRALTNLNTDFNAKSQTLDDVREANNDTNNLDGVAVSSWRVKDSKKRGSAAKRVRSNWVSNSNVDAEEKYSGGEDNDDFDMENSESPLKEQSHIHSLDNLGIDGKERQVLYHENNRRRPIRTRVSDRTEFSGPSDTNLRRCEEDSVRTWLDTLGLGRYAPIFEIHEVDDEILPLLTLEDLKDMGITAVGSRRKLFCAIQKLGKGFS
ncbi:hypothetical protein Godav_026435 [Gossypium davidsonii]|uniref:SAM domain-containing protein n=1 Tax=Gossypium davidsonii TaxID=34287 RepID=A0A7J8RUG3_GOSDV|nr:hypothetical protein [Gossypium davidsonii]